MMHRFASMVIASASRSGYNVTWLRVYLPKRADCSQGGEGRERARKDIRLAAKGEYRQVVVLDASYKEVMNGLKPRK